MILLLLDESLKVEVFFDTEDDQYEDNVCMRFEEDCPELCSRILLLRSFV